MGYLGQINCCQRPQKVTHSPKNRLIWSHCCQRNPSLNPKPMPSKDGCFWNGLRLQNITQKLFSDKEIYRMLGWLMAKCLFITPSKSSNSFLDKRFLLQVFQIKVIIIEVFEIRVRQRKRKPKIWIWFGLIFAVYCLILIE